MPFKRTELQLHKNCLSVAYIFVTSVSLVKTIEYLEQTNKPLYLGGRWQNTMAKQ